MPESQNIEWKSRWKDEYLEWICGYANAQGGKIYIGCDDEGNVAGLPNARKLLEDIPNKIRDAMDDVDDETVMHFKQWAARKGRIDKSVLDEPKDVLMEKRHLMNGLYLTNAAMLLFSKDPEKWQLGAYVKIGYFETDVCRKTGCWKT